MTCGLETVSEKIQVKKRNPSGGQMLSTLWRAHGHCGMISVGQTRLDSGQLCGSGSLNPHNYLNFAFLICKDLHQRFYDALAFVSQLDITEISLQLASHGAYTSSSYESQD